MEVIRVPRKTRYSVSLSNKVLNLLTLLLPWRNLKQPQAEGHRKTGVVSTPFVSLISQAAKDSTQTGKVGRCEDEVTVDGRRIIRNGR